MSKVYFTKEITPESLIKIYEKLGVKLEGNVAVKLHSGEKGNQNYLRPEFVKPLVDHVNGTVVECNTAYEGARNSTEKHKQLIKEHEWDKYFKFDLLDEEGPDLELDVPNGKILKKNGIVIYLKATPECLFERIKTAIHRPLLHKNFSVETIGFILKKRVNNYEKAHHTVDTCGKTPDEVCEKLMRFVK